MDPEIREFVESSNVLKKISGIPVGHDRYAEIFLEFTDTTLRLACDDDTDEIVVSLEVLEDVATVVPLPAFAGLAGTEPEYMWELVNHRGFVDGLQLRLFDSARDTATLQFEVAASAIDIRIVADWDPSAEPTLES